VSERRDTTRATTRGAATTPGDRALGILAQRLHGRVTGVARYIGNLLDVWAPQLADGSFPFARLVLLSREPLAADLLRGTLENRSQPSSLPDAAWEQVHVPRLARDFDVLFCPSYTAPLRPPCPMVVATLDMLQATRPADFPRSARLLRGPLYRFSARRADAVVTLAEATVPAIVEHYGVARDRIHAIPLAADPRFTPDAQPSDAAAAARYHLDAVPFVLFVGKLTPRRHIPELVAGFGRAVEQGLTSAHLALVGPDSHGLGAALAGTGAGAGSRAGARVHVLGHVPDADLPALYRRAALVVYLSEDEGFGLPIVEAMRSGTPVLTLDRPVIREVAGPAAYYLTEATPDTIAGALVDLFGDAGHRAALRAAGLERAAHFNWHRTAAQTLDVLVRAAGSRT
jgi:glycosyltransferase involved in cell wall biosynthesis